MKTYRRQSGATSSEALVTLHQHAAKLGPQFQLIGATTLNGGIDRTTNLGIVSQKFETLTALWQYTRTRISNSDRVLLWLVPTEKEKGRAAVLLDSQILAKSFGRFDRDRSAR